jgi:NAD(P)-dependent dehydrogenase (short-subunit alcohol dehydrogenase family)
MPVTPGQRTIFITGGNRGIGREAAQSMARSGARVLVGSRDPGAGEEAAREIRESTGNPAVEVVPGDLSTRAGVRAVAEEVARRTARLDVLVNNAGVVARRRTLTADGVELQFAVNHLAPFLLTRLLLPLLEASAPARVITVASRAHRRGRMHWDDLQGARRYRAGRAYSQSKLANILFTAELARRLEGTGVSAVSLHPGLYGTGIVEALAGPLGGLLRRVLPSAAEGGEAVARLALDPELGGSNGAYFNRTVPATPSREARDATAARRLWEISEVLLET